MRFVLLGQCEFESFLFCPSSSRGVLHLQNSSTGLHTWIRSSLLFFLRLRGTPSAGGRDNEFRLPSFSTHSQSPVSLHFFTPFCREPFLSLSSPFWASSSRPSFCHRSSASREPFTCRLSSSPFPPDSFFFFFSSPFSLLLPPL
ncbi:hypothetical protein TGRH88_069560 [Toxoplasma gondii]|uniref:Uncharacterized protein n=1 Tax=Toxoplasma gondii TaxID=5811 RepID=A0A7J6K3T3_TOXGO|nr:hypothetical protein TGRH88_069560 [Toxoplasma gondii]